MKRLIMILIILLTISMLSACQETDKSKQGVRKSTEENGVIESTKNEEDKEGKEEKVAGEIEISVYEENELLKEAAEKFMAKYPGTTIKLNAFTKVETVATSDGCEMTKKPSEEQSKENYVMKFNLALMSGTASDLILDMGTLPIDKYIRSGNLADITEEINEFVNDKDYFGNIIKSFARDGKIHSAPLAFDINTIGVNKKLLEQADIQLDDKYTLKKAINIGEEVATRINDGNTNIVFSKPTNIAIMHIANNIEDYININDREVKLDSKELKDFVEKLYRLNNKGLFSYAKNKTVVIDINCAGSMQSAYNQLRYKDYVYYPLANENGDIPCIGMTMSLNAGSENKYLAKSFIKFLLSEDIQSSNEMIFEPINKNAFENRAKQFMTFNNSNDTEAKIDDNDFINLCHGWIKQVNNEYRIENSLTNFVIESLDDYMIRGKDIDVMQESLQDKVLTYVCE